MIDPNEIADSLVDMLRDIPELVTAMGGDVSRISAYHGEWPAEDNSFLAVNKSTSPSILIVPRGFFEGALGGTIPRNRYSFSVFLRPRSGESGNSLAKLILGGVPASSDGIKLRFLTIHPQCLPMTDSPRLQNAVIPVGENSLLEIPELQLTLTENGDN